KLHHSRDQLQKLITKLNAKEQLTTEEQSLKSAIETELSKVKKLNEKSTKARLQSQLLVLQKLLIQLETMKEKLSISQKSWWRTLLVQLHQAQSRVEHYLVFQDTNTGVY